MPYVQRDKQGQIVGLYANPQPQPDGSSLTEPDPLPEDHAEVVAFRQKMESIFGQPPGPMTIEDARRAEVDFERLRKEHERLRAAIATFNNSFAELEIALSALLYEVLHLPKSKLAYAIYFSPSSFDVRRRIIHDTIQQIIRENNKDLHDLLPLWMTIDGYIDRARRLRNALAHGIPHTLSIRGKNHARLTSPAFDVIRVGRRMSDGQVPGLSAAEISAGISNVRNVIDRVDDVNRIISAFHASEPSTLRERLNGLRARLKKIRDP